MELLLNKLQARLNLPLPGPDVQYLMAPTGRRARETESLAAGTYRHSAVMAVFCTDEHNKLFLPLIERPSYQGVHSGQVSLPGGKFEDGDADLVGTALRECSEEIGLENIRVAGQLTKLYIPVSRFMVQPVVGVCQLPSPRLSIQEREVKRPFRLYLEDLLDEAIIKNGPVDLPDGSTMLAPYFAYEQYKIWGATAMILSELKEVLKPIF